MIKELTEPLINASRREIQKNFKSKPYTIKGLNPKEFGYNTSFFLYDVFVGHARLYIDYQNKKITGIDFFPFDAAIEDGNDLKGNGLGSLAFGMLLDESLKSWNVKIDYLIEYPLKTMSDDFRKMLSRMNVYEPPFINETTNTYCVEFSYIYKECIKTLKKMNYDLSFESVINI